MNRIFWTLVLVSLMVVSAQGQVDTLQTNQIGYINCPESVEHVYFANLVGDSAVEMVVSTQNNVYIYNPIDGSILWTSPPSYYNGDREPAYYDMNNDGDLDIAFKDTSGLRIFDFVHSSTIWEGIHVYGSYALGDRSSDGIADVINVRRGTFYPGSEPDTAFIEIYDGPSYQLSAQSNFPVTGETPIACNSGSNNEGISKVMLADLTGTGGLVRKIVIFSTISYSCYRWSYPPDQYCNTYSYDGVIRIVDPISMEYTAINSAGQVVYTALRQESDSLLLHVICHYSNSTSGSLCYDNFEVFKYSRTLSADGQRGYGIIFQNQTHNGIADDWQGYLVDDINYTNPGDELCFGNNDSLWMVSYPGFVRLWSNEADLDEYDYIRGIYHSNLFSQPQILMQPQANYIVDKLYDGSTGELTGVIRGYAPTFDAIFDLNNDGEDELIYIDGPDINFNHLEYVFTSINNGNHVPSQFRLYPAYPNPFNAQTTIQYDLIKDSPVEIGIYNLLGQRIETLVNQSQTAGHHQIIWNAGDVSSGIYFYKLSAGEYNETKKMLLLK